MKHTKKEEEAMKVYIRDVGAALLEYAETSDTLEVDDINFIAGHLLIAAGRLWDYTETEPTLDNFINAEKKMAEKLGFTSKGGVLQ